MSDHARSASDVPGPTAADVCALIARRLDGTTADQWPGRFYAYGADPRDTVLVPAPTSTGLLVVHNGQPRWFETNVRALDRSAPADVYRLDPDQLITLARRAGLPSPW
ncbi:hypothetical protein [Gandjariella thermophila]|uniref:Uncharacterized protein n=1 Tax=Gandjariella thermophila TaxID=1931992 RepID=A0A4D4JEC3_9PSEU|nr:hypothetical protein [Gandjariella thermophila]GDY34004.1 hypothetical protein GTS_56370 [Gandjariella thermophila]